MPSIRLISNKFRNKKFVLFNFETFTEFETNDFKMKLR